MFRPRSASLPGAMSPLRLPLARTIRSLRESAGYSQEGFAAAIQVHRTYMGKLERGETDPGLEVLERVAGGLQTSLSDLLRRAESEAASGPAGDWSTGRDTARRSPRLVAEDRKPPKKKK